ncbi:MAG TPA: head-tail adaptor protein [Flavisolibacter sp.]|nr:head-tail adaptor protein [Flavisolibacter sp.]
MIGQMDRKATFYNPTAVKSASGGTTNLWAQWDLVWCRYEQPSGFKSGEGSMDNLVLNADITIRYSAQAAAFLTKDTKVKVGDRYHRVTDYQLDRRKEFVTIRAVTKADGSTDLEIGTGGGTVGSNTPVYALYRLITAEEANGLTFTVASLIGKTLLTIETGRAIPMGIVTTGEPVGRQMKFDSTTGTFTVPADAPLLEGEDFRFIYK